MKIERFEDLEIWQDARQLCNLVFQVTSVEPFVKDYKFRDQIRSAAGSTMDNIAEGYGRGGNREFVNFLSISRGSNDEVRSQSYRAFDFRYIDEPSFNNLLELTDKISKKTSNLILHLNKSQFRGPKFNR
jgi:four helix bundle protein